MAKRQLSEQAQVAKICRQYIKRLGLQCTARSDSFSMGDSVDVRVTDATAAQRDQIDTELGQYQYGHFDGMTDMYESSNARSDIPQTKYLHIYYAYSDEIEQLAYTWARENVLATDDVEKLPAIYKDADKYTWIGLGNENLNAKIHGVLNGSVKYWDATTEKDIGFWDEYQPATPTPTAPTSTTKPTIDRSTAEVHEIYHTKKETHIYIVTMPSMDRETFNQVRDHVKQLGGWYSRKFGKSPAGFAFNTRAEAESFAHGEKEGSFKPSGTNVNTAIIKLTK